MRGKKPRIFFNNKIKNFKNECRIKQLEGKKIILPKKLNF